MVISDEPGVYLPGRYGIRTENLVLCKEAEENEYGRFLEFEFLTLAPIDKAAILWEDMRKEDAHRKHTGMDDCAHPSRYGRVCAMMVP